MFERIKKKREEMTELIFKQMIYRQNMFKRLLKTSEQLDQDCNNIEYAHYYFSSVEQELVDKPIFLS